MTSPNTTPDNQPVDELDEILKCSCAMNDIINGKHYDDCPKEAKARLSQLLIKERLQVIRDIKNSEGYGKMPIGMRDLLSEMSKDLNKQKLNLENQLGEKS